MQNGLKRKPGSSGDFLDKARLLIDLGRGDQALETLLESLASEPDNAELLCQISVTYINLAKFKEALEYSERSIGCDPQSEWAYRVRSVALSCLHRDDEALRSAQAAAQLGPDHWATQCRLAACQMECGLLSDAEVSIARAGNAAPTEVEVLKVASAYYERKKLWPLVEETATDALALDPLDAYARASYGRAAEKQLRYRDAFESYASLAALHPETAVAREYLVNTFLCFPYFLFPPLQFPIMWAATGCHVDDWVAWFWSIGVPAALAAVILRFCPVLLLRCFREFRSLAPDVQEFIGREWRRSWAKRFLFVCIFILVFPVFGALCMLALLLAPLMLLAGVGDKFEKRKSFAISRMLRRKKEGFGDFDFHI